MQRNEQHHTKVMLNIFHLVVKLQYFVLRLKTCNHPLQDNKQHHRKLILLKMLFV